MMLGERREESIEGEGESRVWNSNTEWQHQSGATAIPSKGDVLLHVRVINCDFLFECQVQGYFRH